MSSPLSDGHDSVLVGIGDVRDYNVDHILPLPPTDIVEIRNWLEPTAYDLERSEYSRHRLEYLAGTGKWLTSTTTYQQWHKGDENGLLWVKGIPGSGKSVLAASIISRLQEGDVPVIFFFFRQIIDANHQPASALRDWLCQLLDYSPPLQVKLKNYIVDKRDLGSLSPSDLWKDLKLALAAFPKVYCVTDALDEMDQGNDEFLHALVQLGQWRPSNVKVLITSRPVSVVENSLRSFSIPQIRLEEKLVDLDIAAYVQYKLRHSSVAPESWSVIEEAIPGRANGLFLYAKLSMDAFLEPGADVYEVLKALPADLNVMYNDMLHQHAIRSAVPTNLQLLVLQFVTHATRPLRILEIAEIAKGVQGPTTDRSLKETKDLVRAACGPLLEILPDETVSVVHHSFTEFLKGFTRSNESAVATYPILQPGSTNRCLAIACLDYLRSGCLVDQQMKESADIWDLRRRDDGQRELKLRFPFVEYAAYNWYIHIRRAVLAGEDMELVYTMLDNFFAERRMFTAWRVITWPTRETRGLTALHVAAWAGLAGYAAHLLEIGDSIEERDACQNTPLYWAASSGHHDVVKVLLGNGADPNAEQNEGYNSLHLAARRNHAAVAKLLLAAGVHPLTPKTQETPGRMCGNAPTSRGHTPLMYACNNGHVETVAEFLPFLENTDVCHQALLWAAKVGHCAVVELIIQHPGVNVNAKCRGETALFAACSAGDEETIRVLLRAGADPNVFCAQERGGFSRLRCIRRSNSHMHQYPGRGNTALHALCKSRRFGDKLSPACVDYLLQAGAEVHIRSSTGETALHYACRHQQADVVKRLLGAGADPTAEDDSGATPLHTEGQRDPELLPVLLSTGVVDINKAVGNAGKTPLLFRLQPYNAKRVLSFLGYKPDANISDARGNGPLHHVFTAYDIHGGVIDTLVSLAANPNARNNEGNTPLHTMRGEHSPFISKLVDAGADLEARNHDGQTALFKHANEEPFETLISLGACLDTRDSNGRTLLHRCCNHTNRLNRLISLGLDPLTTDHQGDSLLMEVAATKNNGKLPAIMKHLVALGLDMDQPNHCGRTTLHVLCSRENTSSSSTEGDNLDYVLEVCKNLNPSDCYGVRPLHLAATISESHVFKLLNAGADMFALTHEGISVLHVAARARQPNIVALFCSRLASRGTQDRAGFVNQQTSEGETALHYACRSGRPETVQVLLEAGADPTILDSGRRSPLRACAQFEAEEQLWGGHGRTPQTDYLHAAGFLVSDHQRPFFDSPHRDQNHGQRDTEHNTVRLDEILDLLVDHGALSWGKGCLRRAFEDAISNRYEYTVDCLSRLRYRLPGVKPFHLQGLDYLICKSRLDATKGALRKYGGLDNNVSTFTGDDYSAFMRNLVFSRQYDLFEEGAKRLDTSKSNPPGTSLLHSLVAWGYKELLERVCDKDAALRFDDHNLCLAAEMEVNGTATPMEPLLVTACDRHLPNMDMVEYLVEKVGVSVNAQFTKISFGAQAAGGTLHKLVLGRNWWHVYKALPYLIKKGANLELRGVEGVTPLHVALHTPYTRGPFRRNAVRILIESGADVNAVDANGETCLSKASNDLEMTRLLLAHGAEITAAAVFSAIGMGEIKILGMLLSRGDYANIRKSEPVNARKDRDYALDILDSEVSPLLFASIPKLRFKDFGPTTTRSRPKDMDHNSVDARIITMLLKHGADPFETYVGEFSGKYGMKKSHSDLDEANIEIQRKTVIHEILKSGNLSGPFFQLPSLQLERRDSSGCTLLLAACKSNTTLTTKMHFVEAGTTITRTTLQELVDRGADVMAQDNDGNTILHHIYLRNMDSELFKTLKEIIIKNPSLLHQPNRNGETFFHRTLVARNLDVIDDLLEMGADPLQPDPDGNTALHHLAKYLRKDKSQAHFKRFLEAGVDINSRNHEGETPLFKYIEHGVVAPNYYCNYGFDEKEDDLTETVFDIFEEAGADFLTQNNAGFSLLHILASKKVDDRFGAKSKSPGNVVRRFKILMSRGLDPMAEDARQRTSLDVAAACGGEHILKLFARNPME